MAVTLEQIADGMKQLEAVAARIEKAAGKPASGASVLTPESVFGAFGQDPLNLAPGKDWRTSKALGDRCKALNKSYNHEAATMLLMADANGRARGCGMGPMLKAMVEAAQGMPSRTLDALEKEFGLVTVAKADRVGIKGFNGEVRKTALAEGSGLTGGYIVPPQYQNELLTIAAEDAWLEKKCRVMPMTTRTLTLPSLDITTAQSAGTAPYFGGVLAQWQPEAATINETEPQFRQTELTAWDLMLYSVSSNQLLADNAIGLDAYMTQLFGAAIPYYKEWAFLNGTGAGNKMPLGIINAPATLTVTKNTAAHFTIADVANMISKLHIRSWKNSFWVMHPSCIPDLLTMTGGSTSGLPTGLLTSTSDRPWWLNATGDATGGPLAASFPDRLLGLPIMWSDKVPKLGTTGCVMLINGDFYLIGNRMDLQIDVSTHYLFRTNQLAWRVIARCDGRPWMNSYITDQAGWTSSPFVIWGA